MAMGVGVDDWTAAIDSLTPEDLAEAAAHAPELQARYDPARIGLATAIAIEALGVQRA